MDEKTIRELYNTLIAPTFSRNERMSETDFVKYFLTHKYKENHHLEYSDKEYVMVWCDFGDECDVKAIEFFVVAKDKRNAGIGRAVFESWLKRNHNPRLFMEIDSADALRFWEKFGLHEVKGLKYSQPALGDGLSSVDTLIPAINFDASPHEVAEIIKRYWFRYGFDIEVDDTYESKTRYNN